MFVCAHTKVSNCVLSPRQDPPGPFGAVPKLLQENVLERVVRTTGSPSPGAWIAVRSWRRSWSSIHTGTFSFASGFGDGLAGWSGRRTLGCSGGRRTVSLLQEEHRDPRQAVHGPITSVLDADWSSAWVWNLTRIWRLLSIFQYNCVFSVKFVNNSRMMPLFSLYITIS